MTAHVFNRRSTIDTGELSRPTIDGCSAACSLQVSSSATSANGASRSSTGSASGVLALDAGVTAAHRRGPSARRKLGDAAGAGHPRGARKVRSTGASRGGRRPRRAFRRGCVRCAQERSTSARVGTRLAPARAGQRRPRWRIAVRRERVSAASAARGAAERVAGGGRIDRLDGSAVRMSPAPCTRRSPERERHITVPTPRARTRVRDAAERTSGLESAEARASPSSASDVDTPPDVVGNTSRTGAGLSTVTSRAVGFLQRELEVSTASRADRETCATRNRRARTDCSTKVSSSRRARPRLIAPGRRDDERVPVAASRDHHAVDTDASPAARGCRAEASSPTQRRADFRASASGDGYSRLAP